jgi:hypothetical protein
MLVGPITEKARTDEAPRLEERCISSLSKGQEQHDCRIGLDRKSVAEVTDFWGQLRHLHARTQPLGILSGPDLKVWQWLLLWSKGGRQTMPAVDYPERHVERVRIAALTGSSCSLHRSVAEINLVFTI